MSLVLLVAALLTALLAAVGGGDVFGTDRPAPLSDEEREALDDVIADAEADRSEYRRKIVARRSLGADPTTSPTDPGAVPAPSPGQVSTPDHD